MQSLLAKLAIFYALHAPNHRGRFRLFSLLDHLSGPFRVRTPAGPELEIFLSSTMDQSYFRKSPLVGADVGIDHVVPDLIARLRPGECFIDVGANIGWLSCLASAKVGPAGRVVAIEPSPREYIRLLRSIARNRASNAIPVHAALSDTDAVGTLEVAAAHTGMNRLASGTGGLGESAGGAVSVPILTGDGILPPLVGDRPVGLVKIDTEGAEKQVLQGMVKFLATHRPRHVVVEITPGFLRNYGATKESIYTLMAGIGFRGTVNASLDQYDEVFIPADNQLGS